MSDTLPAGWIQASVRDLIQHKFTGPSPTCEERQIASDEEWGLLKTTAVTWDGWNELAHKVPPPRYWGNKNIEVHAGDVLITKAGPRHRVGVAVHVTSARPRLMVSGKMVGLRPRRGAVLPQILAGLLSTKTIQEYLNTRTTGMAESQTNFADEALLATELNIPPMPEQRRIAEILDALDDQIRVIEQVIAKLKTTKQGLLKDLLTLGVDEHGRRRDPISNPDQFEVGRLGLLPKGWGISSIAAVCSLIVDCPHSTPNFLTSGILVARTSNIRHGTFIVSSASYVSEDEYSKRISRAEPSAGDLILTREAPVGEAFVVPRGMRICLGQRVMLLRPRAGVLDPEYLLAQLYSGRVRERIDVLTAGTTNPHLNVAEIRRFEVPIPSFAEQIKISEIVRAHDSRVSTESARLDKLKKQKVGLVSDLLTGRTRVSTKAVS